jgi:hypothetical protein
MGSPTVSKHYLVSTELHFLNRIAANSICLLISLQLPMWDFCVRAVALSGAISALAKGLGMTATAEGVETEEQLEAIKSEGCTDMQGYLFGRPVPASEIGRLFSNRVTTRKSRGIVD